MESKDNTDAPSERGVDVDIDEMIRKEQDASTGVLSAQVKGLDANRYATKKTVAQGMLDIALLTSNASQLKYVLQVGPKHEFYTLLVVLISVSIVLQVVSAIVAVVLSLIFNINREHHLRKANALNDTSLLFKIIGITVNVIINVFFSMEMDSILKYNLSNITCADC
ncbi:ninjurin-2 isoform X3 [Leguminivora glycinivorella]|uniref:ninjurin-2 isoform X3 n=1 Tax=Leguminivora glycinivorella TaxID=1035111 RepID=UPI00200C9EA4|nr:ninjurin-2 isoform X3 [Leguminivora glycinivorella]